MNVYSSIVYDVEEYQAIWVFWTEEGYVNVGAYYDVLSES